MFKSITEIKCKNAPYNLRFGTRSLGGELLIGTHKKKGVVSDLVFVIRHTLMKRARFMAGDKVDVLFDPTDRLGWIRLDEKGRLRITKISSQNDDYTIKTRLLGGMPIVTPTQVCESVEVSDQGVIFALPETTVFKTD